MVANNANGEDKITQHRGIIGFNCFLQKLNIRLVIQRAVGKLNHTADLPVCIADLLQRRNRSRHIRALLGFFDGLRPFLHPFLNTDSLALKNGKRMLAQEH